MKRKVVQIILLCSAIALGVITSISAQPSDTDCKQMILDFYKSMNAISDQPAEDHVYFLDYTIETKTNRKNTWNEATNATIEISGNRMYMKNNEMEIWQDTGIAILMLHNRRIVHVADSRMFTNVNERTETVMFFQDTLLDKCAVTACELIKDSAKSDMLKISLDVPKKATILEFYSMEFWINLDDKAVKKVKVNHVPGHTLQSTIVHFNKIDFNYQGSNLGNAQLVSCQANNVCFKLLFCIFVAKSHGTLQSDINNR